MYYQVCPECERLYDVGGWLKRWLISKWPAVFYQLCLTCKVRLRPATDEEVEDFEKYS